MTDLPLICRTHGRAGRVLTLDAIANVGLCVSVSQEPLYREHHPDAVYYVHPDEVVGLPAKMAWMIDNIGSWFSLDDDIKKVKDVFGMGATMDAEVTIKLEPSRAYNVIQTAAVLAREAGAYHFGFNQQGNPKMSNPQVPFKRSGFIGGHAFGLLEGHGLWVHPDATTVDDYWLSALNAHRYRTCFIDQRYSFDQQQTFGGRGGGQDDFRTMEVERAGTALLQQTFGSAVSLKKDTAAAKRSHEHQRKLSVPW
jgi:hypothetical protein